MSSAAVITADATLRQRLRRLLVGEHFEVMEASDSRSALRMMFQHRPDALLVGTEMREGSVSLIAILRAASDLPLLALGGHEDVVEALHAGADDVLDPECDAREILARVRAAMRLREGGRSVRRGSRVETGALVIDLPRGVVTKSGVPTELTRTESSLLEILARNVGRVVPHAELLAEVWGPAFVSDIQYLRVYCGYLRRKLEDDPRHPRYLLSEWGVGYRLAQLPLETWGRDTSIDAVLQRAG